MPIELSRAQRAAERLAELLRPAASEVTIAGSIRRCKPEVKDIEIVALLREDLTGPHAEHALSAMILDGIECGQWTWDARNDKRGPRYKRLLINMSGELVGVDLFIADSANHGNTLAIRTGDSDWTHKMVTRGRDGLMPEGLRQGKRDGEKTGYGYLWRKTEEGEVLVPCRTEQEYFDALNLPAVEPPARNMQTALALIEQRRATCR